MTFNMDSHFTLELQPFISSPLGVQPLGATEESRIAEGEFVGIRGVWRQQGVPAMQKVKPDIRSNIEIKTMGTKYKEQLWEPASAFTGKLEESAIRDNIRNELH